jgi:NAD(P)-dependent dehydrogenase (short-subunit alcohol dehydrogenase family)
MKEQTPQGGRIINNGSISADRPRPGSIAYTASKHAVTGLTKSLALDGRDYSIACGQVNPPLHASSVAVFLLWGLGSIASTTSKHAVTGLTKSLALVGGNTPSHAGR